MNIATNTMERLTKMLLNTDSHLKKMGSEPYGKRRATPKEEREMYDNLTSDKLMQMIDEKGVDNVNEWLSRFEGGQNGYL